MPNLHERLDKIVLHQKSLIILLFKAYFLAFLVSLLFIACQSPQSNSLEICDKDLIKSEHLITAPEAFQLLDSEVNTVLIEVSKEEEFKKGHIPEAHNLWRPDFRSKSSDVTGIICSSEELTNIFNQLGVTNDALLLLYDRKGSVEASRLAWILDYYRYTNYKIINGGLKSWEQNNYPISKESSNLPRYTTSLSWSTSTDSSYMATMEDVKRAILDTSTLLIDTRENYEHLGQPFISKNQVYPYKKGAFAAGCIPGSIHLNWSSLSDLNDDHRIKCEKDLVYNLSEKNITRDKDIIVYCQSGSRSSHTAFVLRHVLGYKSVKNYDGSWIEWTKQYAENKSVEIEQKTDKNVRDNMLKELELKLNKENG